MFGVLEGLLAKKCFSYMDNIRIFGCNGLECLAFLRRVFSHVRQANFKVKQSKSKYYSREVTILNQ